MPAKSNHYSITQSKNNTKNTSMNTYQDSVKSLLNIEVGIKTLENVKVILYNMFGQVVLSTKTNISNGRLTLRVATLSQGTYQAHIHTNDQVLVKRVVKQ